MATLAAVCLVAPAAPAATLKNKATGMTLKAPSGYKLKFHESVFSLRGPGRYVQFMSFRSPMGVKQTGNIVLAGIKAKRVKHKTVTSKRFQASARVKRRAVTVRLLTSKGVTQLAIFGGSRSTAALERILRTRRGEPVQDINIGIPMKKYTAPVTNGASAMVPDLPGWRFQGNDSGYIGGQSKDGIIELGSFTFVNYPTNWFPDPQFATAAFQPPAQALANVFPSWKLRSVSASVSFQQINPLAGTEGNLGPGYQSQAFEVSLIADGVPMRGIFNVGTTESLGSSLAWGLYYSYAVEKVGGASGILDALLTTWGTWNNSAASAARIKSALESLQKTRPVGGGAIDDDVFQNAADAWDEYIRGPED
ncbi:MAG: hypothetical protein JHC98_09295 [Thermoleophilaceae bacterium]|nr:hypothetical protein [Thermoleophilaceae bacterium]